MASNVNEIMNWHELMADSEASVRNAFQLKDQFISGADKRIARFTQKFWDSQKDNKKKKKIKQLIYVGIHIRLRDAYRDMVKHYKMPVITTSSYLTAMNALVDRLETKATKLIFLIMTDDPMTVHYDMMPRLKKGFNAYLAGTGHVNNRISVGLDLAMMSRCNYTILSYGTFSYWSGFLSGGPRLLPKHYMSMGIKWNGTNPKGYQDPFLLTDVGF